MAWEGLMRFHPKLRYLAAALAAAIAPSAGSADTVQPIAPIVALRLVEPNSDEYSSFHGFILVGDDVGGYLQYKWGGNHCPGLDLSSENVAALQRGMNNPRILIAPRTKTGAGGNQCLVAFTLVLRSDVGSLP
jgi:opacity protein-like surface antigen